MSTLPEEYRCGVDRMNNGGLRRRLVDSDNDGLADGRTCQRCGKNIFSGGLGMARSVGVWEFGSFGAWRPHARVHFQRTTTLL